MTTFKRKTLKNALLYPHIDFVNVHIFAMIFEQVKYRALHPVYCYLAWGSASSG